MGSRRGKGNGACSKRRRILIGWRCSKQKKKFQKLSLSDPERAPKEGRGANVDAMQLQEPKIEESQDAAPKKNIILFSMKSKLSRKI